MLITPLKRVTVIYMMKNTKMTTINGIAIQVILRQNHNEQNEKERVYTVNIITINILSFLSSLSTISNQRLMSILALIIFSMFIIAIFISGNSHSKYLLQNPAVK